VRVFLLPFFLIPRWREALLPERILPPEAAESRRGAEEAYIWYEAVSAERDSDRVQWQAAEKRDDEAERHEVRRSTERLHSARGRCQAKRQQRVRQRC